MPDLPGIRERHHSEIIALAGGVFDLMHPGHIDLFKRMKSIADVGVVAVSTDERVRQRKGPLRPIHSEAIRLEVVDAIRYVDYTLVAPSPSAREVPTIHILRSLRPDILMSSDNRWQNYPDVLEELDVELVIVPRFNEEISTTHTINRVVALHTDALSPTTDPKS